MELRKKLLCAALAVMMLFSASALADYATLKNGDSGSAVLSLQQALATLGYFKATQDGKYGTRTENAVRAFQKANSLGVDGKAGNKTLTLLYSMVNGSSSTTTASSSSTKSSSSTASSSSSSSYFGGVYTTIEYGDSGSRVKLLQKALNTAGYGTLKVDGKFGASTLNAVKAMQKACKLTQDGKAGTKTLKKLESLLSSGTTASSTTTTASTTTTTKTTTTTTSSSSSSSSYTVPGSTLRVGSTGTDVKTLQKRLKELGWYTGSIDGKYGNGTYAAVKNFQSASKLTADGVAGSKTYAKLFADSAATASSSATTGSSSSSSSSGAPSKDQIKKLYWYTDIKPNLKSKQTILVYDPSSGLSWTLRLYSLGRHADAEPLTAKDTATMVKAFGGVNTWTQKGVYVRLPDGTWTIAATHDMPHLYGSISDNNFDGHLCVHFLREMAEAEQNDPKYGVANQETIRTLWQSLTGETISN